jgi:O-antigen/teichoic acid export membrane protein
VRSGRGRIGTALHLALGLGVLGAAGYAFVAVVGHVFARPDEAGALSALISLYLVVNIVGPGIFAALEQETSRAVSAAIARGDPVRPVARHAAGLALRSLAVLVTAVLVAWPLMLHRVLDGRIGLLVALLVAIVGSAAVYWARGVLGGQQRFTAYARTLYVEGAVRLLPGLGLVLLAVAEPAAYGMAFALGSALAALSVAATVRTPRAPGAPVPAGMGRSLSYLMVAVALSQLVANLAPVVVTFRSPEDLVAASVFGSTFVLARIPLFLFAPVQAVLLPKLTRAATLGHGAELRRRLRQVVGVVVGVGAVGVLGCVLVGPWAAEVLFNTAQRPTVATLALLGAATMLMLVAMVMQPTLIALGRQQVVTVAWVAGTAVFLGLLVLPLAPITAALVAQLAGPAVVVAVLSAGAVRALRAGHPDVAAAAPRVG